MVQAENVSLIRLSNELHTETRNLLEKEAVLLKKLEQKTLEVKHLAEENQSINQELDQFKL